MSIASIKTRLLEVQQDDEALRMGELGHVPSVVDLVPELMQMKPKELADQLLDWWPAAPDAVNLLLKAAAKSDESALHVARAVVQLLTLWREGEGPWTGVEELLVRAFPQLEAPERDWVAERSAVRQKYRLVPGKDYLPMGEPDDADQWPLDQPLPPIDSTSGVQARLLRAGYNSGPITGEWNEETQRALVRYQIERALPGTGQLDRETLARLADEE